MVRFLVAAAVLAAGTALSANAANAADLLPPPPALDGPLRGSIVADSGFYVRGDLGIALNTTAKGSSTSTNSGAAFTPPNLSYDETTITSGPIFGVGAGYRFNNWFRADVTGEYRGGGTWRSRESYDDTPGPSTSCVGATSGPATTRCSDIYKASIDHGLFLANGYFDVMSFGSVTPYVGVGIGTAYNRIGKISDTSGTSLTAGTEYGNVATKWNLAWALMAGASVNVARGLDLDLGYRYVDMGKMDGGTTNCTCTLSEVQHFKFASHDFRVGLRYAFGDTAPAPMPMRAPTLMQRY